TSFTYSSRAVASTVGGIEVNHRPDCLPYGFRATHLASARCRLCGPLADLDLMQERAAPHQYSAKIDIDWSHADGSRQIAKSSFGDTPLQDQDLRGTECDVLLPVGWSRIRGDIH